MSEAATILRYDGPQPDRQSAIQPMVEQMMGEIREIGGRLHELGCVIVDSRCAPNYITELHFFPLAADKLN